MKLTVENVHNTVLACLFSRGEDTADHVAVTGVVVAIGFHPARLEAHRTTVVDLLAQLPPEFRSDKGASFLDACVTADGVHWGEHRNMEELFLLGMALKLVEVPTHRSLWSGLRGGMPVYRVVLP